MSEQEYPQTDYSRPPEAIEIVLVRHGASQAAVDGQPFELLEGQADPPLAEEGRHQALRVAMHLADEPMDQLFVTPLCRTAQTATPLAAMTGFEPVVVPELREVHLGELDGGAFRIAVDAGDPRVDEVFAKQRWDVIPGAESMEDLAERTRAGIDAILARARPGSTVIAIVHGGIIGEVCRQATGSEPFAFVHAANGSLTRLVVFPDGRWRVRTFNEGGHLRS
ncbi:MAG: 2,3-bisphosphoglycerate-dependent phosphoglycerate mutase [Solirubrobacteraceae bacterium]|nr:2,3-bisphosphoglycerate-dependent phosphoglycerate mutase [Solirubrobacteraceae bacterium]